MQFTEKRRRQYANSPLLNVPIRQVMGGAHYLSQPALPKDARGAAAREWMAARAAELFRVPYFHVRVHAAVDGSATSPIRTRTVSCVEIPSSARGSTVTHLPRGSFPEGFRTTAPVASRSHRDGAVIRNPIHSRHSFRHSGQLSPRTGPCAVGRTVGLGAVPSAPVNPATEARTTART